MVCIYKDMVVHPVLGVLTGAIVNPYELMTLQYKSMTYPYETPIPRMSREKKGVSIDGG